MIFRRPLIILTKWLCGARPEPSPDPAQIQPRPGQGLGKVWHLKKLSLFLDFFLTFLASQGGPKCAFRLRHPSKITLLGQPVQTPHVNSDNPARYLRHICGVSATYRISNPEASWSPQFQDKDLRPVHQRPRAQHGISHAKGPRPGELTGGNGYPYA